MSKSKRSAKSSRKQEATKRPKQQAVSKTQTPSPDCPYRGGTLYGTLFVEGNRDYIAKEELIKKVAQMTGKSEKVVGFAYQVLKSKNHPSNKNRSTQLVEDGDKVKLIPIRK